MDQQVIEKKPGFRPLDNTVAHFVRKTVRAYFDFLAKLPTWGFVLAVAVWTVVFKTALVPIVALLNAGIFAPLGLDRIYSFEPVPELASALTKWLYDLELLNWDALYTFSEVLLAGLFFPMIATLLAQIIPQHGLRKQVPSERHRAVIAVVSMGLLYLLSYGQVALLISGGVIAVPLVFTFFHRMRAASLINAYVISAGIHAVANTIVVLCRGLLGGD